MKKKILFTLSVVAFVLIAFAACGGAPESKNQEIIDAYKAAGYSLNPSGTEAAKAAFDAMGEQYKVDYIAKDLTVVGSQKMFILFKCKTTKEANEIEKTYKDIYTVKVSGVDVMLFFVGSDVTPWNSVFA